MNKSTDFIRVTTSISVRDRLPFPLDTRVGQTRDNNSQHQRDMTRDLFAPSTQVHLLVGLVLGDVSCAVDGEQRYL